VRSDPLQTGGTECPPDPVNLVSDAPLDDERDRKAPARLNETFGRGWVVR
jgi:hypothetical protein